MKSYQNLRAGSFRYDDRFIRTRLMTADRYFSELKFAELPKCTKGLRMLIFSYHSPESILQYTIRC